VSILVDVSAEGVRVPLARERVRELARFVLRRERVRDALVSIAFVSTRAIARLNADHLGHVGATDVISFALDAGANPDAALVGDIYICPDVARANAIAHASGVREELARLVVHGVLHVAGHEHPEGAERERSAMWLRQERLLRDARESGAW
jgi:probable rRNA maturation factor